METQATSDKMVLNNSGNSAALVQVPEHLRQYAGDRTGKENVGMEDLLIPRLAVAQGGLTPQLKKQNEGYIPGLEEGMLFNTVTGEVYGTEVDVLPLFFFKNFIHFKPMTEGGGVLAQFQDQKDVPQDLLLWKDGKPPMVTEFKNRMALIAGPSGRPSPIVVSFKSTGIKFAKQWNSMIAMLDLPSFARFYRLKVVTQTKGTQSWYGIKVQPGEFAPAEVFNAAKTYFENLSKGGYKVDTSGLDDSADSADAKKSDEGIPF